MVETFVASLGQAAIGFSNVLAMVTFVCTIISTIRAIDCYMGVYPNEHDGRMEFKLALGFGVIFALTSAIAGWWT